MVHAQPRFKVKVTYTGQGQIGTMMCLDHMPFKYTKLNKLVRRQVFFLLATYDLSDECAILKFVERQKLL